MGLDVYPNRAVAFNDQHEKRVDTSLDRNPSIDRLNGLVIRNVFKRKRVNAGDRDDGNPLIYALKGMWGYSIMPVYKNMFIERARLILTTFASELGADHVMPLPSGNAFCGEFADLVSGVANSPVLAPSFLRKRTVGEMLELHDKPQLPVLNDRATKEFKAQLAAWKAMSPVRYVAMKEIDMSIRHCFAPLVVADDVAHLMGKRVILVDDLMASGASLQSCREVLEQAGATVVSAVCFLSRL